MDLRKLKTLIELVQESGIAELEVTGARRGAYHPHCRQHRPADDALRRADDGRHAPAPGRGRCAGGPPSACGAAATPAAPPSRWPSGQVADGWHLLPRAVAGANRLSSGQHGHRRRHALHHRTMKLANEIEADKSRRGQGRARRIQSGCGIRPGLVHHRIDHDHDGALPVCLGQKAGITDVRQGPDRQPRRDRAAHPARLPRNGHQDGGGALRSGCRRQSTSNWPTSRSALARRRRHKATSTCPRSSRPPR